MTDGNLGLPSVPAPATANPAFPGAPAYGSPSPSVSLQQPAVQPGYPPPPAGAGQVGYQTSSASSKGRKGRKVVLILVLLFVLAGVLAVGGAFVYMGIRQEGAAASVPATAFIGECFGNDESLRPVPCEGPHHYEVFSAVAYGPDVEYPGRFDLMVGNVVCDEDLETYTGAGYFNSRYDYVEVYPSEADWDSGNRLVLCALFLETGSPSSGPAEGRG